MPNVMPLGMVVGIGPRDILLDGDPASRQKRGTAPNFRPFLLWQNGWMDQDATWYGGRPRPRPHCVRWGPSSPSPSKKRGTAPQFSAHVYCGHTAGWIKMPLGTEVCIGPGYIVLDGDPAFRPQKGHSPHPPFKFSAHVCCGQTVAHLSYCWALVRINFCKMYCFLNWSNIAMFSIPHVLGAPNKKSVIH